MSSSSFRKIVRLTIIWGATTACVDFPNRVRHSSNPTPRTPPTRRPAYCCHSISTLPRRTQHVPTTSRTTGCPSTRAGTTVLWMALSPLASRSIPMMPSSPWATILAQTFLFTMPYLTPLPYVTTILLGDRPHGSEPPLHHGRFRRPRWAERRTATTNAGRKSVVVLRQTHLYNDARTASGSRDFVEGLLVSRPEYLDPSLEQCSGVLQEFPGSRITAPPGTPDEYITAPAVPDPTVVGSPPILGPIGLGFRVPMLVISPFSRGGLVSSALFDHTSVLRFLETRFGAEVPNLSAWRRATVGDLTSALNFSRPDQSIPALPSTLPAIPQILAECVISLAGTVPYQVPNPQSSPTEETGTAARPSGPCSPPRIPDSRAPLSGRAIS